MMVNGIVATQYHQNRGPGRPKTSNGMLNIEATHAGGANTMATRVNDFAVRASRIAMRPPIIPLSAASDEVIRA